MHDSYGTGNLRFTPSFKDQFEDLNIQSEKILLSQMPKLEKVVYDPEIYKMCLFTGKKKITFQAIQNQNFSSMEIVLDRCSKEKPDLILLPLDSGPVLESQK